MRCAINDLDRYYGARFAVDRNGKVMMRLEMDLGQIIVASRNNRSMLFPNATKP
jgi:hypothetical protein